MNESSLSLCLVGGIIKSGALNKLGGAVNELVKDPIVKSILRTSQNWKDSLRGPNYVKPKVEASLSIDKLPAQNTDYQTADDLMLGKAIFNSIPETVDVGMNAFEEDQIQEVETKAENVEGETREQLRWIDNMIEW
jgi:hypothetical protein